MAPLRVPGWLRPYIDEMRANGYDIAKGKGGHIAVVNAQGKRVATLPATPGKGRSVENNIALLRRLGVLGRKGEGR
jgi:predicted RNA binding protein YcfA (HicA-like mRNA interferase family)